MLKKYKKKASGYTNLTMQRDKEMNQNKKIITVLSTLLLGLIFALQANSTTVQRSNFIVDNLSCTSCLATIETELKGVPGTLGMDADIRSGRVTVDHLSTLDDEQIAATISKLGYPATVDWTATVPEQNTRRFTRQSSFGSGCSSGGCGSKAVLEAAAAVPVAAGAAAVPVAAAPVRLHGKLPRLKVPSTGQPCRSTT